MKIQSLILSHVRVPHHRKCDQSPQPLLYGTLISQGNAKHMSRTLAFRSPPQANLNGDVVNDFCTVIATLPLIRKASTRMNPDITSTPNKQKDITKKGQDVLRTAQFSLLAGSLLHTEHDIV
jgi:hypothetical protein